MAYEELEFGEIDNDSPQYTVDDALQSLAEDLNTPSAAVSYGLSQLTSVDVQQFMDTWQKLPVEDKRNLLVHLIEVSEANFELNYRALAFAVADDSDPLVRTHAVELLWEDESTELLEYLTKLVQWDESSDVRAAAASALGRFVLLGEYGKLPEKLSGKVQDAVIGVWSNEDEHVDVRRRALEAISNSSHAIVSEAIMEGYQSNEIPLVVSSIYAMGRSCDERWAPSVLKELSNDDPQMRYEAAKASGELELKAAIPALTQIAVMDEHDIREVAIWSLGEIGGSSASRALEKLSEQLDDEEWEEVLEDAIANANLGADMPDLFGFHDFDEDAEM